jgi:hypothetical protein
MPDREAGLSVLSAGALALLGDVQVGQVVGDLDEHAEAEGEAAAPAGGRNWRYLAMRRFVNALAMSAKTSLSCVASCTFL